MRIVLVLTLAGALALGACKRSAPEEMPAANNIVEPPVEAAPVNAVTPPPAPVTDTVAPPPRVSEQEQMRDDADATGLTARLPDAGNGAAGAAVTAVRPVD